jgi:hypothetical protein
LFPLNLSVFPGGFGFFDFCLANGPGESENQEMIQADTFFSAI